MKYINENYIHETLKNSGKATPEELRDILSKARSLQRLTLAETAALLATNDPEIEQEIFTAAAEVKDKIYGKRIVLFAPLYISNICANNCLYCAFKADNKLLERKALNPTEIKAQTEWLLQRGHMRILLVAGESAPSKQKIIDYYCKAVEAIYSAQYGQYKIKRVNINCAPLSVEEFKILKSTGIGTYQIFQETYHEETYRRVHVGGPKSDPDNRITAIDRAFQAGIDDVGIGVLYGLYDYRFDTLAMLSHIEHLEKTFGIGPHTISVPRIEPALGSEFSRQVPHPLTDEKFRRLVAILRLSVPYTGLILSTRENAQMRDELINLGISQISAESSTSPGGYSKEDVNAQFSVSDHRTLDEIVRTSIEHGLLPSFCAACYRKERTGEAFMHLAKPGTIKNKCSMNALITLKEYLDDFASPEVRTKGYTLIEKEKNNLSAEDREYLEKVYQRINSGRRDEYV